MTDKPTRNEDEYFAREDALKKEKIAKEQAKALEARQKEDLKKLHFMHCPKCGMELQTIKFGALAIDRCFSCKGTWLDEGELEQLAGDPAKSGAWMKSVLNIFKTK
jgi:uncharacterized protein